MATTRLMPLHVGKGRDVSTAIADIIDYVENPQKTDFGKFILAMSVIPGSRMQSSFFPSGSI